MTSGVGSGAGIVVVALARATAPFGVVSASHIRDEADYSIGVVAVVALFFLRKVTSDKGVAPAT